jgi:hypothetical protein
VAAPPGEPAKIQRMDAIWGLYLCQLVAELRTRVIDAVPCAVRVYLAPVVAIENSRRSGPGPQLLAIATP